MVSAIFVNPCVRLLYLVLYYWLVGRPERGSLYTSFPRLAFSQSPGRLSEIHWNIIFANAYALCVPEKVRPLRVHEVYFEDQKDGSEKLIQLAGKPTHLKTVELKDIVCECASRSKESKKESKDYTE